MRLSFPKAALLFVGCFVFSAEARAQTGTLDIRTVNMVTEGYGTGTVTYTTNKTTYNPGEKIKATMKYSVPQRFGADRYGVYGRPSIDGADQVDPNTLFRQLIDCALSHGGNDPGVMSQRRNCEKRNLNAAGYRLLPTSFPSQTSPAIPPFIPAKEIFPAVTYPPTTFSLTAPDSGNHTVRFAVLIVEYGDVPGRTEGPAGNLNISIKEGPQVSLEPPVKEVHLPENTATFNLTTKNVSTCQVSFDGGRFSSLAQTSGPVTTPELLPANRDSTHTVTVKCKSNTGDAMASDTSTVHVILDASCGDQVDTCKNGTLDQATAGLAGGDTLNRAHWSCIVNGKGKSKNCSAAQSLSLDLCQGSCDSGVSRNGGSYILPPSQTLFACVRRGGNQACGTGGQAQQVPLTDQDVSWTNSSDAEITVSDRVGVSTTVSRKSGSGKAGSTQVTARVSSLNAAVGARFSVSCIQDCRLEKDPSTVCSGVVVRGTDRNCGGSCNTTGTKSCNSSWTEVAP